MCLFVFSFIVRVVFIVFNGVHPCMLRYCYGGWFSMQNNCLSPTQFLNICSLSVRGLSGQAERTEMFNWLREKNFHVFLFVCLFVFVKEVHCTEETLDLWQNEWVTKQFLAVKVVAILFKNKL